MKELFTHYKRNSILVFAVLLNVASVIQSFARTDFVITIDNEKHALIAPEGLHYQWFRNREPLQGEINQELLVTESGDYSVEVVDEVGAVTRQDVVVAVTATGAIIKIYIIGDSTVCNYPVSQYPWAGWGQVIPAFFNSTNISITNNAIGGRSSRSFYKQGRWDPIKNALVAGNYVFIQFGHNDRDYTDTSRYTSVSDYKTYLTTYCNDTKAKGAIPVLVSPMVMNAWTGATMRNVFTENGNDYRGAMLDVATALDVAFVDLNMKSWNLYKTYGANFNTRFIYKGFVAGEYPNYPAGITDGTHFQEMGAICNARMIVEGINELSGRSDMTNLITNLQPQYSIGISVNPTTGKDSMTTRTYTYPAGLTVTLKTIPKVSSTFQKWNNATNTQISTVVLTTVTSSTAATSYTVVYQGATTVMNDCNNTPNGTAKQDICDRCVAGTTGKTACSSVGEAETDACAYDGVLESTNAGFKGTSYINVNNAVGASITFNVTAANAGSGILSFRYANGGASDRPAEVSVNGSVLANNLSFPATGAFTTWKVVDLQLTFVKGSNTVRLSSTTTDGMANIDQIGYVSAGLAKGNCVVTGIESVDSDKNEVLCFPNPFFSSVTLVAKGSFFYLLSDITGKLIESGSGSEEAKLGADLQAGVYIVNVQQGPSSTIFYVIKK